MTKLRMPVLHAMSLECAASSKMGDTGAHPLAGLKEAPAITATPPHLSSSITTKRHCIRSDAVGHLLRQPLDTQDLFGTQALVFNTRGTEQVLFGVFYHLGIDLTGVDSSILNCKLYAKQHKLYQAITCDHT